MSCPPHLWGGDQLVLPTCGEVPGVARPRGLNNLGSRPMRKPRSSMDDLTVASPRSKTALFDDRDRASHLGADPRPNARWLEIPKAASDRSLRRRLLLSGRKARGRDRRSG